MKQEFMENYMQHNSYGLMVQSHLRFTQLLLLRELIIDQWIVLHSAGTFMLATGPTIAIAMQQMVHTVIHAIAIVNLRCE